MKRLLATVVLAAAAACAAFGAAAQSLPHGVTIDRLQAVKDTSTGATVIQGALHNNTGRLLNSATVLFRLQDAQGNVIGTTSAKTYNLPDKESWQLRATTPLPFTRFTAYEVKVE
jgi:opacity protein-like surface antigen